MLVDDSDPTPDGGGCGSVANPCNTIATGITHANPGDTVSVASGAYAGGLTISKTITLVSQSGPGSTSITGGAAGHVILVTGNPNFVTIDGFDLSNPTFAGLTTESTAISVDLGGARNLTVRNNVIHDVRNPAVPDCGFVGALGLALNNVGQAGTTTLVEDNHVSAIDNDGCNSGAFPSRSMARGIWVSGANAGFGTGRIEVRDNVISGLKAFRPAAIDALRSNNFVVSGNTISGMTATNDTGPAFPTFSTGVHPDRSDGGLVSPYAGNIVNNTVDGAGAGVRFETANTVVATQNTFTNLTSPSGTFTAVNAFFDTATGNTFCGNAEDYSKGNNAVVSTGNFFRGGSTFTENRECPSGVIIVIESGGSTDVVEGGATDTYTVQLGTAPGANVVVTPHPDSQVTVSPASLTFTPANWNMPQAITVTAVDDATVEGTHVGNITHDATSSDPTYNGLSGPSVIVHIQDNDLPPSVIRIPGDTPLQQAIAVSKQRFPDGSATVALLARNDVLADAFAGGPLSNLRHGPLLLTARDQLDADTLAELTRVLAKDRPVYLLGGTQALAARVESDLAAAGFVNRVRFDGSNRDDTATRIATEIAVRNPTNSGVAFLTEDRQFVDALASSAIAGQLGSDQAVEPLLFARRGQTTLEQHTRDFLAAHADITTIEIVGGTAAVPQSVEDQLRANPQIREVKRRAGVDRFDSARVLAEAHATAPTTVVVVNGESSNLLGSVQTASLASTLFTALLAGPFAAEQNAPLLLVRAAALPAPTETYLRAHAGSLVVAYVVGSTGQVSDAVAQTVGDLIASE